MASSLEKALRSLARPLWMRSLMGFWAWDTPHWLLEGWPQCLTTWWPRTLWICLCSLSTWAGEASQVPQVRSVMTTGIWPGTRTSRVHPVLQHPRFCVFLLLSPWKCHSSPNLTKFQHVTWEKRNYWRLTNSQVLMRCIAFKLPSPPWQRGVDFVGTPNTTAFVAGKILRERVFGRGTTSSVFAHPGWSWPWICRSDVPYLLNFVSKKQGIFTEHWTESFFFGPQRLRLPR